METGSDFGFSRTLGDSGRQPARRSSFPRVVSVAPDWLRGVFIKSARVADFAIGLISALDRYRAALTPDAGAAPITNRLLCFLETPP